MKLTDAEREIILPRIEPLGFTSTDEITRFETSADLYCFSSTNTHEYVNGDLPANFSKAKHEVSKVLGELQLVSSIHDPVVQELRHFQQSLNFQQVSINSNPSSESYVDSESIRSSQSPAAYLKYIYDIARNEITTSKAVLDLDQRRPDIKDLYLTSDMLKNETSTLRVVNYILSKALLENMAAQTTGSENIFSNFVGRTVKIGEEGETMKPNEDDLFSEFEGRKYPFIFPFHRQAVELNECLLSIGNFDLNTIEIQSRQNMYAFSENEFSLTPLPAEKVGINHELVNILSTSYFNENLYNELYGYESEEDGRSLLQTSSNYCKRSGISLTEFFEIFGKESIARDDSGTVHEKGGNEFICASAYIRLDKSGTDEYRTLMYHEPDKYDEAYPLQEYMHEIHNKCIRIMRAMNWSVHEVNMLFYSALQTAQFSSDSSHFVRENELLKQYAVTLLGKWKEWNDSHSVTVEEFSAIIGNVNMLYREGKQEETLTKKLFGDNAESISARTIRRENNDHLIRIDQIEEEGLGGILRRGFKLSRNEWDVVMDIICDSDRSKLFSADHLSILYRITKIFSLFSWEVLPAIQVCQSVDSLSFIHLFTSTNLSDILSAIDKFKWLSIWMKNVGFSISELNTVLTKPELASVIPSKDTAAIVQEVQLAFASSAIVEFDFASFKQIEVDGEIVEISENEWINGLTDKVFDRKGLVITERKETEELIVSFLKFHFNTTTMDFSDVANELSGRIESKNLLQNRAVANQVIQNASSLTETSVAFMLSWMGTSFYSAKKIFSDFSVDRNDDPAIYFLFDILKHIVIIDKFRLEESELQMLATNVVYLGENLSKLMSLEQIFLLSRFKELQNSQVSANDWIAFFERSVKSTENLHRTSTHRFPKMDTSGDMFKELSVLLDWPAEEIQILFSNSFSDSSFDISVKQADCLARQIDLCKQTKLSASELVLLRKGNKSSSDWSSAASTCLAALKKHDEGKYFNTVRGKIDERERDALVEAYMLDVVEPSTDLKELIPSRDKIYEYLLIDVEVSSQVPTTPMLEATYAVQLFITRAILNIESTSLIQREYLRRIWDVAQQYRLWEADQKLQQFPSSYIEPHLRIDKTELFNQFEHDLTQGDLNEDTAQAAIHNYISSLQNLTELNVSGFCKTWAGDTITIYLTARGGTQTHLYYYRKLSINMVQLRVNDPFGISFGEWNEATIPASSEYSFGVYPCYAWGRLYLFWFELKEEQDEDSNRSFYLMPKYSRQNLDGTFTNLYAPRIVGSVLDITKFVNEKKEEYQPTVLQPEYIYMEDSIKFLFSKQPDASPSDQNWHVFELTSFEQPTVSNYTDSIITPYEIDKYEEIRPSRFAPRITIQPPDGLPEKFTKTAWFGPTWHSWFRLPLHVKFEETDERKVHYFIQSDSPFLVLDSSKEYLKSVTFELTINGDEIFKEKVIDEYKPGRRGSFTLDSVTREGDFIVEDGLSEVMFAFEMLNYYDDPTNGRDYVHSQNFTYKFTNTDFYNCRVFHHEESNKKQERFLLIQDGVDHSFVVSLFSSGLKLFTSSMFEGADVRKIYDTDTQNPYEEGSQEFAAQVDLSGHFGVVKEPKPLPELDYNGAYGLYAWELFYYIPSFLLASFRENGQFQEGLSWMRCVFDPSAENGEEWVTWILRRSLDTGALAITDPDNMARKQVSEYRLATIRHYLEALIDRGDKYYREETAESLRMANMVYVEGKNLFFNYSKNGTTKVSLPIKSSKTLENTTCSDFLTPVNGTIQSFIDTLESRFKNLRLWRSINGDPLNIPLLASPIDPKLLQMAAISGIPPSQAVSASQMFIEIDFNTIIEKAKDVVRDFIDLGKMLYSAMQDRDNQMIDEMKTNLAHYHIETFEEGSQAAIIDLLRKERDVLTAEKAEADKYLEWYTQFANEFNNSFESKGIKYLRKKNRNHTIATIHHGVAGGLGVIPNVFGFAFGGADADEIPDHAASISENAAERLGTLGEIHLTDGDFQRRMEENEMERDATTHAVDAIQKSIDAIDYEIADEEATYEALKEKTKRSFEIVQAQARRVTNSDFNKWYVGKLNSLHSNAFDIAVRFCKLAERKYQNDNTGDNSRFINPVWDVTKFGLLSGQSLLHDLQRMDLAYMERYTDPEDDEQDVYMNELSPSSIVALKQTGRAMFSISESIFEENSPGQIDRRIKSVKVEMQGPSKRQNIKARLTLIAHHRSNSEKIMNAGKSFRPVGNENLNLSKAVTDSASTCQDMNRKPFVNCGVESTWMISIPAAVVAIQKRKTEFPQKKTLRSIRDIKFTIRYSYRNA